jgi:tetratricopeptide (TPR) repeat protein
MYPIAVLAITLALWRIGNRWRGPLAAWLFFCGTLFPVLGLVNVSYFTYSFVADHLQYLASLGPIALTASGIASGLRRLTLAPRHFMTALCLVMLTALAIHANSQGRLFADPVRLYENTIERNPRCWVAHNNLGSVLVKQANTQEAIQHFRNALKLRPQCRQAWNNLGVALTNAGHLEEAVETLRAALAMNPDHTAALYNLGLALTQLGRHPEAVENFKSALRLAPQYSPARLALGATLYANGLALEAIEQFKLILQYDPNNELAKCNLGLLLHECGEFREAIPHLELVVQDVQNRSDVHYALADAYRQTGRFEEAIQQYNAALRAQSDYVPAYSGLATVLAILDRSAEAITTAQKGIEVAHSTQQKAAAEELAEWLEHYRIELLRTQPVETSQ